MRQIPIFILAILSSTAALQAQQPLTAEELAQGLSNPVAMTHAPGMDSSRLYVATQTGRVRIIEDDTLLPGAFLDISALCLLSYEEGQSCLAFHPDYPNNRKLFVTYTDLNGDWVLAQYLRDPLNPNLADPNSAQIILTIQHPTTIHYSGWMEFGPDGYLYLGVGDGGPQDDPFGHAQDGGLLLGKLLRLDVDHPAAGLMYGIPPGNPFLGDPNIRDEIWALGLRNPWRCDVDDLTGDVWIGDVGLGSWEEVNFLAAGTAGANLGWAYKEGDHCHRPTVNCDPGGLTDPIHEWAHGGSPFRCSITGGQVYRGRAMADMQGRYFFADFCSGEVWSMRWDGQQVADLVDHTPELATVLGSYPFIIAFGADADGELYLGTQDRGRVLRLIPAGFRLRVGALAAGRAARLRVEGGTPNLPVALLFSLTGLGSTSLPRLGLVLSLDQPRLASVATAGAMGEANFAGTVPLAMQDRSIWFQAAQRGQTTNVTVAEVE